MVVGYKVIGVEGQRWKISGRFIPVGYYTKDKDSVLFNLLQEAFRKGASYIGEVTKKVATPVKPVGDIKGKEK